MVFRVMKLKILFKKIFFLHQNIGFFGKYTKFSDALNKSHGYSYPYLNKHIYNQSKKAIQKKKFEQDGIIYNNPKVNKFFVNYLVNNYILKKKFNFKKKIKVLDYGGSFGNLFYSLKKFIHLKFQWEIIEQKEKVLLAKKSKFFKEIKFFSKINKKKKYDIIIFNTSFQYLDDPIRTFKILEKNSDNFILTNLILTNKSQHYLRIENPDPKVYKFTYPCWFFSEKILFSQVFKKFYILKQKAENTPYKLNMYEKYFNILLEKKK